MAESIASALECPLSQLVVIVTYARGMNLATPVFAANCSDFPGMLTIFDIIHYVQV